jgi:hypothetical protein
MQRLEFKGREADPMCQCRTVNVDTLAREDLSLPIQRQMIRVFRDEYIGDKRLRRQAAFNQAVWRWRLHDPVGATAAGIFGSSRDDHAQLRRDPVETLGGLLADDVKCAAATRAGCRIGDDDVLLTRQMSRKMAAIGATFLSPFRFQRAIRLLPACLIGSDRGFEVFQT